MFRCKMIGGWCVQIIIHVGGWVWFDIKMGKGGYVWM